MRARHSASLALGILVVSLAAPAQAGASQATPPDPAAGPPPVGTLRLPPITVVAQKEPADPQRLPVSVTTVTAETVANAGITFIGDASVYAPNTYFTEFTARKLSNPRFRGVGASPLNPAVTTYFDGVPQLNASSSSVELMDVEQIEFVRGPQSALFGRNTLAGLINVTSRRPSLSAWSGSVTAPFGSRGSRSVRAGASGPLAQGRVGVGLTLGYSERDGFTRNDVTGRDLDHRSAFSGKGQVLWTPSSIWEMRVIVAGERARDGDYALNDLEALRRRPFRAARDFEGHTDRDLVSTTVLTRREGGRVALTTTTGIVRWRTEDATDLDYSPLPLVTRDNREKDLQFTQEVRLASAASAPVRLSDAVSLTWQSGVFVFGQSYEQDAVNTLAPFVLSPVLGLPVSQTSPHAALDDRGVGIYGQATVTLTERLDVSAGVRLDHERKEADLRTFFAPPIAPPTVVETDKSFSNISPQFSAGYRVHPERSLYAAVGRGFKAGGFNPTSPAGSESYLEEHTWHAEGGVKTAWDARRIVANAALFHISWQDLQLNLPDPAVPAQFYVANVGGASSTGVEVEVNGRAMRGVDLFGAAGVTRARFDDGSVSSGLPVGGNKLPGTPSYTLTAGAHLSHDTRWGVGLYGRAELTFYGQFMYDDANRAGQDAYSLASLRIGASGRLLFADAWLRNAFDTRYIPVAFAYGPFAPSGFIGEMGQPRTFGVSGGVRF